MATQSEFRERDELRRRLHELEYDINVKEDMNKLIQNPDYIQCIHDINSTMYALTSVYVNHYHRNSRNHVLLRFTKYEENGVVKNIMNGRYKLTGLIPYTYYGRDFEEGPEDAKNYEIKIPFSFASTRLEHKYITP